MAAQCPPPSEQAGRQLQHEGDRGLQDQGAGEEASSPAGGARGDGGVVVGGD